MQLLEMCANFLPNYVNSDKASRRIVCRRGIRLVKFRNYAQDDNSNSGYAKSGETETAKVVQLFKSFGKP